MDQEIKSWVEDSPYGQALGARLDELGAESARISLPYKDDNSNPGKVLHGGCAASLGAIGGQVLARAALGSESGPWHTAQMQVSYLSAAIGQDVVAEAELLRRGKELCFVSVVLKTSEGKPIARTVSTVRGRFGAAPTETVVSNGDHGESDPGTMGPHIGMIPFIGNRGIQVEHMKGGTSRLVMPWLETNADRTGGVHEGAVLALLDTTGAMASWAESGPGRYKASTASMQLQNLGPTPRCDLVAYGRCVQRDAEMFWSDVEVGNAADGRISARGTVLYRIVT
ncbi:MAG: PaaI family thioesterase [Candidatus Binatia bacterium]|nr:PaaI family thioesterase [Candidatus Binatia bacterium]